MGLYKYLQNAFKSNKKTKEQKQRLIDWRKEPVLVKTKPTNVARARALGYKAKQGFSIIRIRLERGGRQRPRIKKGRAPRKSHQRSIIGKSYQWIAEERAQRRYTNLEVLNSYQVGKDGLHYWFEIIMVDPCHPAIEKDKHVKWIARNKAKNRVYRGKTSAARKSRGLTHKGKGTEKTRPSIRANKRRGK